MGWFRLWLLKRRIRYWAKRNKIVNPGSTEEDVQRWAVEDALRVRVKRRAVQVQEPSIVTSSLGLGRGEASYVLNVYQSLSDLSNRYWKRLRTYRILKTASLVVAASVPVVASTAAPKWSLAALSAVVVVIEGFIQLTRYQEQAILEMRLYSSQLREYEEFLAQFESQPDKHKAFEHFVEQISKTRKEADQGLLGVLQLSSVGGQGQRPDAEASKQPQPTPD